MGYSSVCPHRGLGHWKVLLVVVSLLNFWSQPTSAKLTFHSISALEGNDVTLQIFCQVRNVAVFLWYRGEIIDHHHYIASLTINEGNHTRHPPDGKVMVEDDGSLLLKNVTSKDTGIYTILVQLQGCQQLITCARLDVYPVVSAPTLVVSNTTVTENKDVVLFTCFTDAEFIEWFFNGASLRYTREMKLSHDLRVLTINPVMRWDAGEYHCLGSNPRSSVESNRINLEVKFV